MKIMKMRQTLFWDTNPKNIDVKKNAQYIIERVADFGNDKEVKWIFNFYNKKLLKKVIAGSRCLRSRTKNLWTLLLNK
ncbi:hypothetical protein COY61_01140 [bacterium (Candidatus Gribaldobacteria) CG_4_10_14_0_8_um_filter_33_9]|uniref:DUF6922 domain-containing protein n=1 Tax=bacterium (Candidatus Gribaldobacteria) CG_4_10_14_0_8_um_filter_33_9 TaxID=2014266 RepID=A0A2M7RN99_9BACT|nr:MAG: hypothetical protein COY61_01140 [bacterium (Candidatus Gribaldobacteria) CG_4_10_14_0_8_um_filter_33_9]